MHSYAHEIIIINNTSMIFKFGKAGKASGNKQLFKDFPMKARADASIFQIHIRRTINPMMRYVLGENQETYDLKKYINL